jgi:uncharacterized iron-regulated membrane protein
MNLRSTHRKVSVIILLPLTVIILSGLILQLRNQFEWIQPKTISATSPQGNVMSPEEAFHKLRLTSDKVEQYIYRPSKKNISIRLTNGEEIQIDPTSGEVLKQAKRRTNLLIDLHQGSILGPVGQYGFYLLSGIGLLFLLISGGLILLPRRNRHV